MGNQLPRQESNPVFLLGFHRGGTTFVQRLLNCHEDLVVWGEHAGIFHDFAAMTEKFSSSAIQKVDVDSYIDFSDHATKFIPWANPVSIAEFRDAIANQIDEIFSCGGKIGRWGIKEIRYSNESILSFMNDLFPNSKFLFLTRDPVAMYSSALNARWGTPQSESDIYDNARRYYAHIRKQLTVMETFHSTHPDNAMVVSVEDITDEKMPWGDILRFLDLRPQGFRKELAAKVRSAVAGSSYREAGKDIKPANPTLVEKSIAALKQVIDEGDCRATDLQHAPPGHSETVASVKSDLRETQVELRAAQRQLRHANRTIDQMASSTSWRMTAPLRSLRNLVVGKN